MYEYKATVVKIVDADTFDVSIDLGFKMTTEQRLRLEGVDAWEVRGEERTAGLAAKAFVVDAMPVGSTVIVRTEKTGKYGRYIAKITLPDGRDLGETLIKQGHAEPYPSS